ncbi:hypothetical protein [Gluconacetobacter asukensis]
MDAIALKDGQPSGLHLHVAARLEPGDRPPEDAHLFLDTKRGPVSLFPEAGNELVPPLDEALAAENPNVVAALSPNQEIRFQATASVDRFPANRFTGQDARTWLSTLDRQISHKTGFLLSAFVPATKSLTVTLPPRSEFSVTENKKIFSLVRNQADRPYAFTFQPRLYPAEAVFSSTRPISGIAMVFPVPFSPWKRTE